jgi:hypothetical protein
MALNLLLFTLSVIVSRILAAPFSSIGALPSGAGMMISATNENNGAFISASTVEVPPGYSPTAPPLELTVYPSSQTHITVTFTQPAYTVTVTSPPQTTVTTITARTSEVPTTILPPSETPPSPTEWTLPLQFSSMDDAFSIEHYAFGRENVHLSSVNQGDMGTFTDDSTPGTQTILEITYPRGSYSPSHEPRGGTDFYAVPLFSQTGDSRRNPALVPRSDDAVETLRAANNVTMSYSVFFPDTFDFVKGGKLPGLYGGHEKSVSCASKVSFADYKQRQMQWWG